MDSKTAIENSAQEIQEMGRLLQAAADGIYIMKPNHMNATQRQLAKGKY